MKTSLVDLSFKVALLLFACVGSLWAADPNHVISYKGAPLSGFIDITLNSQDEDLTVEDGSQITFTASGGSGEYVWTIAPKDPLDVSKVKVIEKDDPANPELKNSILLCTFDSDDRNTEDRAKTYYLTLATGSDQGVDRALPIVVAVNVTGCKPLNIIGDALSRGTDYQGRHATASLSANDGMSSNYHWVLSNSPGGADGFLVGDNDSVSSVVNGNAELNSTSVRFVSGTISAIYTLSLKDNADSTLTPATMQFSEIGSVLGVSFSRPTPSKLLMEWQDYDRPTTSSLTHYMIYFRESTDAGWAQMFSTPIPINEFAIGGNASGTNELDTLKKARSAPLSTLRTNSYHYVTTALFDAAKGGEFKIISTNEKMTAVSEKVEAFTDSVVSTNYFAPNMVPASKTIDARVLGAPFKGDDGGGGCLLRN